MKITDVEPILLRSEVDEISILGGSAEITSDFRPVVVKIHTDEGLVGVGESHATGHSAEAIYRGVQALADRIVGEDPGDVRKLWERMYTEAKRAGLYRSLSAIDEALWDVKGKRAGLPLYELLGGETQPLRAYATFPHRKPSAELVDDAARLADTGFELMKITVGGDVDGDRERIEAVCDGLPAGFGLAVDANTSYSYPDALTVGETAADRGLAWFEEPIPHTDVAGQAALNRAVSVPIAGYQTHTPQHPVRPHLEQNALEIYQPALDKVGGVTAGIAVASAVETYDKRLVPHTFGPAINFAATLHLVSAYSVCDLVEFAVYADDAPDLGAFVASPYVENQDELSLDDDGVVSPPERPGLGVVLDDDVVAEYRIDVD